MNTHMSDYSTTTTSDNQEPCSVYTCSTWPDPVHEHNHTGFLEPEVLCSLVGPETQNVPVRKLAS